MEDIQTILNDETLTSEQKAEKIREINVELTNKAVEKRLIREKEKAEKEKETLKNNATALEDRLTKLEEERNKERERFFKNKYKDNWEKALEKSNKGYEEEDIDKLFEIKLDQLKDFSNPLDQKTETKKEENKTIEEDFFKKYKDVLQ